MRILVVGAKPDSLGAAVKAAAEADDYEVVTAGMSGEDIELNVTNFGNIEDVVAQGFHHVVCTAGVNKRSTLTGEGWLRAIDQQMRTNFTGPMMLLGQWVRWHRQDLDNASTRHFVAISSNSANVARSQSLGYCSSKAALSMGVRCAAREVATLPFSLYAYEPGWLEGTPMSRSVEGRLAARQGSHTPTAHRIPAGVGIRVDSLARQIVHGITYSGKNFNGTCIRVDGGEQ